MTSDFIKGFVDQSSTCQSPPAINVTEGLQLQRVPFAETKVFLSLPPVVQSGPILPVGVEYFNKQRHIAGDPIIEIATEDFNDSDDFNENTIIIPPNITPDNLDQFTYYEILGLSSYGDSADRHMIRKAYHKAVLLYHPDKMHSHGHSEEECRAIFLRVQAASETLTDVSKRRAYDSMLDFDESIPSEAEAKEASLAGVDTFLELFEPVFKRNARFALRKPVPSIGTSTTSITRINEFYNYWVQFDSWRDFTSVNREHDPDQAQGREHKRWMQKENEKNAKKLKKVEMARLNDLVTRALAHDPRVLADKERVRAEKAAQKKERELRSEQEKLRKENDAKALEEDKANRLKEEKLQNERMKKQASKARNTFRKLVRVMSDLKHFGEASGFGEMTAEDCDFICQNTDTALLIQLNERMGGEAAVLDSNVCVGAAAGDVAAHLQDLKKTTEVKKLEELKQTELRKKEHDLNAIASTLKKKGANREWSGEEFSVLAKGIRKFPAGSRQRWVTISNFMNDLLKPTIPYEKEECLQASQNAMKIMATLQETSGKKSVMLSGAHVPLPTSAPEESAASIPSTAMPTPISLAASSARSSVEVKPPGNKVAGTVTKVSAPRKDTDKVNQTAGTLEWSQEQQQSLESGLKKFPASMDKHERWDAIAAEVPGKSKKECILRFKKLREELQAAKSGNK